MVVIYRASIFILFFIYSSIIFSQNIRTSSFTIQNKDTILISTIPLIDVSDFRNISDRHQYNRLKRKVIKVYPYAILAKRKLLEIEQALDTIPKRRKKKKHSRLFTKWLKDEYAERLKNLTMSEGKVLVKLVYRETNISTYDIVKSYRGRFNAFFWQTIAKLYNNNLKTLYDPENIKEDMMIETIIIKENLENKPTYYHL
ncbi:MAG: DUF4294 domain-containing protein [Bacteroidota bacterium]|nr:DUF4294 domain-containing protein [Bacteroidota bacterium]